MKRIAFLLLIALSLTCIALPASAQTETTVYSTAQRFDSGLMIWRSDTSLIWVLGNNGQAYTFPASTYANLPDNPIVGTPPSRLRPIFGFGKVWGNSPDVRNLLGWPTLPEIGFDMRIRSTASAVYLTQLDQSVYQVNTNGTWQYATNPPTIGPLIQSFTAAPSPVVPGGTITVNWQIARVDSASLEMYDQGNTRLTLIENLPASGSQTITAPPSGSARIVLWGVVLVRPDGYIAVPTRVISS
ncbi:MAG: hypothetical protein JNJ61_16025, partial [Anaerolineae bacterium]|nr:hypothetical protein [Anaerolineae bacterium]